MTKLSGDWLENKGTQTVFTLLKDAGFEVFVVGGCVRDALLGLSPSDIDFATNASPDQIEELAERASIQTVPTGKDHGTITLVIKGQNFEVTTYRTDVETDGRHAIVKFSSTMGEDAKRRDFTMNALYADSSGQVIDPLEGLTDLHARRVRFIGDPACRIKEDHLRILRFFRFFALFGSAEVGIDADGLAACAAHAEGLNQLSKERIGAEMRKLLAAVDPAPAGAALAHSGVLMRVLPGANAGFLAVLVHMEQTTGIAPNWLRRLAILGGENPRENLRLSKSETRRLGILSTSIGSEISLHAAAYRFGADVAADIALLRAATFAAMPPEGFQQSIKHAAAQKFPVQAADLMPEFEGPALGARLRELEARWIASEFQATKSELLVDSC